MMIFKSCVSFTIVTLVFNAFAASAMNNGNSDGCTVSVEEFSLGIDPRDNLGTEVKIDVYTCFEGEKKGRVDPLVVFASGGSVPKSAYASFASGMSKERLVVAVIEHNIMFGFGPPRNFVNPVDIVNTIDFVASKPELKADMDKIILMGHSFGAGTVLRYLNGICTFPFCRLPGVPGPPQGVTFDRQPGIILAGAFGASLFNPSLATFDGTLTNTDIPFGIINGDGDINSFQETDGENLTQGTFDRLNPTKVIATLEDLDHFSISEVNTDPDRGDILSALPREEQITKVIDAMYFWIKVNLRGQTNTPSMKFCKQLRQRGKNGLYEVEACLEEYVD